MIRTFWVFSIFIQFLGVWGGTIFSSQAQAQERCEQALQSGIAVLRSKAPPEVIQAHPQYIESFRRGFYQEAAMELYKARESTQALLLEQWMEAEMSQEKLLYVRKAQSGKASNAYEVRFEGGLKAFLKLDQAHSKAQNLKHLVNHWSEVSSYKLDRLVGLHAVPVTVARHLTKEELTRLGLEHEDSVWVSIQAALESVAVTESSQQDEGALKIFDYLQGNIDRNIKTGHNLIKQKHFLGAIDNGAAFRLSEAHEAELLQHRQYLVREPETYALLHSISVLPPHQIVAVLSEYLSEEQIQGVLRRQRELGQFYKEGSFPSNFVERWARLLQLQF
ncbi:MAG: hypothetical protein AAGB31_03975 [Bdellovibrio sp.]